MSRQPPGAAVVWTGRRLSQAPSSSRLGTILLIGGIVLVGLLAVGVGFFLYFARQRKANTAARLEREWLEQRRLAAERLGQEALEAHRRVASIPIETVVPVFILQPDGRLILAAHKALHACRNDEAESDGSQDGSGAKLPVPRTPNLCLNASFGWRQQADCPSSGAEPSDGSAAEERQPPGDGAQLAQT